eukprot:gnl/MRDRNA2_/MRDRNA2_109396_c0_seq1.p1 gnl/MRDRNA2_/MRDRNA2_109396_c0~~gnl/MRDRNA2_/MRDRNA2_109396_c0_seq1.p1  ORF type:complete len:1062 (+),score=174.15 gnl/MRDRNA2_/MRDRNA2_109396_c0_seq1:84-3188(+)
MDAASVEPTDVTEPLNYSLYGISEHETDQEGLPEHAGYPASSSMRPQSGMSHRSSHSRPRSGGSRASSNSRGDSVAFSLESVGTSSSSAASVVDETVAQATNVFERPQSGKSMRSSDSSVTFSIESVGTPSSTGSVPDHATKQVVTNSAERPYSGSSVQSVPLSVESVGTGSSAGSVPDRATKQVLANSTERPYSGSSVQSVPLSVESVGTRSSAGSVVDHALRQVLPDSAERPYSVQSRGSGQSYPFSVESVGRSSTASSSFVNRTLRDMTLEGLGQPISARTIGSFVNRTFVEMTSEVLRRPVSAQSMISAVDSVGTSSSVGGGFIQEITDGAVDKAVGHLLEAHTHARHFLRNTYINLCGPMPEHLLLADMADDLHVVTLPDGRVVLRDDSDGHVVAVETLPDGRVLLSDGRVVAKAGGLRVQDGRAQAKAGSYQDQEPGSELREPPNQFEVIIVKGPSGKLGWTRQGARILTIKEGGLIDDWNKANEDNPSRCILQGDILLSVNDVSADKEELLVAELQKARLLRLCFKRRNKKDAEKVAKKAAKLQQEEELKRWRRSLGQDPYQIYPLWSVLKLQGLIRGALYRLRLRQLEKACIFVQRHYRARLQTKVLRSGDEETAPPVSDGGLNDEPRMYDFPPHMDPTGYCLRRCGQVRIDDHGAREIPLLVTTFVGGDRSMLRHCDLHINNQNLPAIFCRIEANKRNGEVKANFAKGPYPEDIVPPAVRPVIRITISPWAGPVGLEVSASGEVQRVEPGSQAAIAGIKRRWRLKSVAGAPVVSSDAAGGIPKALQAPSLLKRTVNKGQTFSLHFEVDGPEISSAINKKGIANLCVGSRLRFGHTWWELIWKKSLVYVDPAMLDDIRRCKTWGDLERTTIEAGNFKRSALKEIELLASSSAGEVVVHIGSASPEMAALRAIKNAAKVGDFLSLSVSARAVAEPAPLPQPTLAPPEKWPQNAAFKMMRSNLSAPDLLPGGPRAPKHKIKPRLLEPLPRPGKPGSLLPGNASYWPAGCAPDFCRFEKNDRQRAFAVI